MSYARDSNHVCVQAALISSRCALNVKSELCASPTFQTDVESINFMYRTVCLLRKQMKRFIEAQTMSSMWL